MAEGEVRKILNVRRTWCYNAECEDKGWPPQRESGLGFTASKETGI